MCIDIVCGGVRHFSGNPILILMMNVKARNCLDNCYFSVFFLARAVKKTVFRYHIDGADRLLPFPIVIVE